MKNESYGDFSGLGAGRGHRAPRKAGGWLRVLVGALGLMIAGLGVPAAEAAPAVAIILSWDANTEAGLAGYRVRHGVASGAYTQTRDVGNVTEVVLTEMTAGTKYFFVVSAYDALGQEGPLSDEINFTPTPPPSLELAALSAPPAGDPGLTAPMPTVSDWASLAGGAFRFVVTAAPGQTLAVYGSSDMLNWEWLGSFSNPTGRFQATDGAAGTSQTRYYQVLPGGG